MSARFQNNRTIRWDDLTGSERGEITRQMSDLGKSLPSRMADVATDRRAALKRTNNPARSTKLRNEIAAAESVGVRSSPISIRRGVATRRSLMADAAERARSEGNSALRGTGWYFEHGDKILGNRESANPALSDAQAVTATTMLSPQTGPAAERNAGAGAMRLSAGSQVELTPKEAARVNSRLAKDNKLDHTRDVSPGSHHSSDYSTSELTAMSTVPGISADTDSLRQTMAGSHGKRRSMNVALGSTAPEDAINPHKSPKVFNYRDNTLSGGQASPAVRDEYTARAQMLSRPGEPQLDLWGLRQSEEGLLSSDRETAEDTWMQGLNTGQRLPRGNTRTSPAKFVASTTGLAESGGALAKRGTPLAGDPALNSTSAVYAFSAEATKRTARQLSAEHGFPVPSVLVQETAWTEARIQADKDPEYAAEQRAAVAQPSAREIRGQKRLKGVR